MKSGREGDTEDVHGFLLVDDRDGRVIAEFADPVRAFRALDALELEDPELARTLSLVRFDQHQGAVVEAETSTRLRPLT